MKKIIPVSDLRNTSEIVKLVRESKEPIYVTKNGYGELVLMSNQVFENLEVKEEATSFKEPLEYQENKVNLGLLKVSSVNIASKINHVSHNEEQILKRIKELKDSSIIVFPELSLTSCSCEDMFLNPTLLNNVEDSLMRIKEASKDIASLFIIGAPLRKDGHLYNCAITFFQGKILGVTPKRYLEPLTTSKERRYFSSWKKANSTIQIKNLTVPFGNNILYTNLLEERMTLGVVIGNEAFDEHALVSSLSRSGAKIICHLDASKELIESEDLRRTLIKASSYQNKVAYVYSSASMDESSSEQVYSSHNLICELGEIIAESELFSSNSITTEIDLEKVATQRLVEKMKETSDKALITYSLELKCPTLTRKYNKLPFIVEVDSKRLDYSKKALSIQAHGLIRRMKQIGSRDLVLGISGGLDSTLSLLVAVHAFDLMNLDRKGIHAITLPCFGTTSRTKNNATLLCEKLGVDLKEVNIQASVKQHLLDLGVKEDDRSTTFENAQARERTQVLMDYANKVNGLVLGTGDLSEIALGWSTYNGDHMSMYNVNCTIPKTLVREMTYQLSFVYQEVQDILLDIIGTPVSPELLPPKEGEIAQITEDLIGPYELHDFFLYHFIYEKGSLEKVYYLAKETFKSDYKVETIEKWLSTFVKRFYNNQFKRSCSPDGPQVTEVSLSPRGSFLLPSDSSGYDFLNNIK